MTDDLYLAAILIRLPRTLVDDLAEIQMDRGNYDAVDFIVMVLDAWDDDPDLEPDADAEPDADSEPPDINPNGDWLNLAATGQMLICRAAKEARRRRRFVWRAVRRRRQRPTSRRCGA